MGSKCTISGGLKGRLEPGGLPGTSVMRTSAPWRAGEGATHTRYWSLIFRSCMRSGLRLFMRLSISRLSEACALRSCSSFVRLSCISAMRDLSRSEFSRILRKGGRVNAHAPSKSHLHL